MLLRRWLASALGFCSIGFNPSELIWYDFEVEPRTRAIYAPAESTALCAAAHSR